MKRLIVNRGKGQWMARRFLPTLILVLSMIGGLAGCSVNPATGERQFNLISPERAVQMGQEAAPQFEKEFGGPIPADEVRQLVKEMGQQLASVSERPDLPWEFHAVNSSHINAFALPGGKIFITRGLMARMTSMAQLAGVLGHEVGHVTAEHVGQRQSWAMVAAGVVAGVDIAARQSESDWSQLAGPVVQVGSGLALLKFSRSQEYQSDMLGLRYMTKIGYDPQGQVEVMKILKEASGGGGGAEWLSTHPLPASRIDQLQEIIDRRYPDRTRYNRGRQAYQEKVLAVFDQLPPAEDVPKPQEQQQKQEQQGG